MKIRIRSRIRFTAFILICLFAVTGVFNTALGINSAAGLTVKEYTEIQVSSGDTLWSIATTYMPDDMDTRKAIRVLRNINSIDGNIYPGDVILVPENYSG